MYDEGIDVRNFDSFYKDWIDMEVSLNPFFLTGLHAD